MSGVGELLPGLILNNDIFRPVPYFVDNNVGMILRLVA
jgi:hypothetical protein